MNEKILSLLNDYRLSNNIERENAVKEVFQVIILHALSKTDFFSHAIFYGGTSLRIIHHIDRFSEDLDFAVTDHTTSFNISNYFDCIRNEFKEYGFIIEIEYKEKNDQTIQVQTAYLKCEQIKVFKLCFPDNIDNTKIIKNQLIKIKFEADLDNPEGGIIETYQMSKPSSFQLKSYDLPTLFAGKIAAILCRSYTNRIKGRDYYDYLFYISKNTSINLAYLENKLKSNKYIPSDKVLSIEDVKKMLLKKFNEIDYNLAKIDVAKFIKETAKIDGWNKELFISTLNSIK